MPSHTQAIRSSSYSSARSWIDSQKGKGYKRIVCNRCCHKWVANDYHKYKMMEQHYLKCDPSKVQWCYVCRTHSTTSDIEMQRHIAREHPYRHKLKHFKTFHTQKKCERSSGSAIQALSIQWQNLDIDTLFQNPDIFKPQIIQDNIQEYEGDEIDEQIDSSSKLLGDDSHDQSHAITAQQEQLQNIQPNLQ